MDGEGQEALLHILTAEKIRPDAMINFVPQNGYPIRDMSVGEVAFLRFAIKDHEVNNIAFEYEKLLALWCEAQEEAARDGPTPKFFQYGRVLSEFVNRLDDENDGHQFDALVEPLSSHLANPWLSYGRPLNGYPVTVDTRFDDETIIESLKEWLKARREADGSSARRPFNQNDFDDWEYYKIREIFDLETWAAVSQIKILDRVIAAAVWPNAPDSFSPIDVLRTTARNKAKEIFSFETVVRLYGQLRLTHGENFFTK